MARKIFVLFVVCCFFTHVMSSYVFAIQAQSNIMGGVILENQQIFFSEEIQQTVLNIIEQTKKLIDDPALDELTLFFQGLEPNKTYTIDELRQQLNAMQISATSLGGCLLALAMLVATLIYLITEIYQNWDCYKSHYLLYCDPVKTIIHMIVINGIISPLAKVLCPST